MRCELAVPDVAAMEALGARLAAVMLPQAKDLAWVGLQGDLGAGKTTLVRAILRALGVQGAVKSPSFTLVEPYSLPQITIYHFDFYRLQDPEEVEFLGLRDYCVADGLGLVEWPQKAEGFLPQIDIDVIIQKVNEGRRVQFESHTAAGAAVLGALACSEYSAS